MAEARSLKRGEIYWVDLQPRSGSEQSGRRPAIIVSHDSFNENDAWRSIIVVPLSTSARQRRRGPTAVLLSAGEGGLQLDSVALCHQVTTVDRSKFITKVGQLSASGLKDVDSGLAVALSLFQP